MSTIEQARRAREASTALATLTRTSKDAALHATADAADLEAGRGARLSAALLDRLALSDERIAGMAAGLRHMAALPDPVGEVVRGAVLPNGLELRQVRV